MKSSRSLHIITVLEFPLFQEYNIHHNYIPGCPITLCMVQTTLSGMTFVFWDTQMVCQNSQIETKNNHSWSHVLVDTFYIIVQEADTSRLTIIGPLKVQHLLAYYSKS